MGLSDRHCEERSDEAIQGPQDVGLDCFVGLRPPRNDIFYFFANATIMSNSTRAPGELSWLTHKVVLAGRQSPK